ncbi:MAG: hypothetical protein LLF98_02355 [Clostridium sp.]|nr:hypothetical protein [Clostridium sp.]
MEDITTWYTCPNCKTKLFKLLPNATANNIIVYCKKCKQEITVNLTPNTTN